MAQLYNTVKHRATTNVDPRFVLMGLMIVGLR